MQPSPVRPQTFGEALDQRRRVRALVVLSVCAVGIGAYRVVYGSGVFRLSGLALAAFGGLLMLALVFSFERAGLSDPRWSTTWWRRMLRAVLVRFWWVVAAVLVGVVGVVVAVGAACADTGCTWGA